MSLCGGTKKAGRIRSREQCVVSSAVRRCGNRSLAAIMPHPYRRSPKEGDPRPLLVLKPAALLVQFCRPRAAQALRDWPRSRPCVVRDLVQGTPWDSGESRLIASMCRLTACAQLCVIVTALGRRTREDRLASIVELNTAIVDPTDSWPIPTAVSFALVFQEQGPLHQYPSGMTVFAME